MLGKRILSAIIGLPLLVVVSLFGGFIFRLSITFVATIALFEYYNAVKNMGLKPNTLLGIVFGIPYLLFFRNNFNYIIVYISLILMVFLCYLLLDKRYSVIDTAISFFGIFYTTYLFSFLILLRDLNNGNILLWLVFVIAWTTDTSAYFVGIFFGKNKLCPQISPNKTIEGAIGGTIGCTLSTVFYTIIFKNIFYTFNFSLFILVLIGILGSILSQIGDLTASVIKRQAGIKDYGYIIPGHGGVLDRFDSILFVTPLIVLLSMFIK